MGGGITLLFLFTLVSGLRRGSRGWAGLFWGFLFGVLGSSLYRAGRRRHGGFLGGGYGGGGFTGGGFSGGGFGGGFSGGGGATGSW